MKNLSVFSVDAVDHLVQPGEFKDVTPESPALTILTDFRSHWAHVVEAHISAADAVESMLQENVDIKLVINPQGEFIGVVSYEDLSDQSIMLMQSSNRIPRREVLVSDLMHPRESIQAINYEDFRHSTVADIIYTLQRHGQQYYLVVDRHEHHIRGVVSSAGIARRLHKPVPVEKIPTVANILNAVRG